MSDPVTATTETVVTPAATTQTTNATQEAPKHAPTIAELKAKRAESSVQSAQPVAAETKTEPAKETPKPAETTVQVEYSAKALEEIAKLNAAKRELESKLKEYEPAKTEAQKIAEARELAKSGKHLAALEALAAATGLDMTKANLELLGQSPQHEANNEVQKLIDGLKQEIAELKGTVTNREQAETIAAVEAGKTAVIEHVRANATKYPYLSRKESWISQALVDAKSDYDKQVASGKEFTDEERDNFVAAALDKAEKVRAEDAKIYGVEVSGDLRNGNNADSSSDNKPTGSAAPQLNRGQITQPAVKPRTKMTFEQLKQKRRELQRQ